MKNCLSSTIKHCHETIKITLKIGFQTTFLITVVTQEWMQRSWTSAIDAQLAPSTRINHRKLLTTLGCFQRSQSSTRGPCHQFSGKQLASLIDAYSKYPCIHPTTSTSTKSTTEWLEQDFAHFGFLHTIVSDNATSFSSEEFQALCRERGIIHLTGAPYHPATNGAAERLVQTFKQGIHYSITCTLSTGLTKSTNWSCFENNLLQLVVDTTRFR